MSGQRPLPMRGHFDDEFWGHVARGEYRMQRCEDCGFIRYPPAPCCPACLSESAHWDVLSGTGRIVSWTRFHRQYFADLPPPYVVVSVATTEGPMVIGNLVGAAGLEPMIGAAVELQFETVATPEGELRLPQWTIAKHIPDKTQLQEEKPE